MLKHSNIIVFKKETDHMAHKTESALLVAIRVNDTRPDAVSDGSIRGSCSKCGLDVWLPAASAKLLSARPTLVVRCLQCSEFLEDGTEVRPVNIVQPRAELRKKKPS
jgi:hypothetical protein